MAEEPQNLILEILRRVDEKVSRIDQRVDQIAFDVHELKVRMTVFVEGVSSLNRRMNRLEERVERTENRLNLVGPEFN